MTAITASNNSIQQFDLESSRAVLAQVRGAYKILKIKIDASHKAQAEASQLEKTIKKADDIFKKIEKKAEALKNPVEFASLSLEWAALVAMLEEHANIASGYLSSATAPLKLISLIAKMKKVQKMFFGSVEEETEATKPLDFALKAVTVVSALCSVLSWLKKMGLLSPAAALMARVSLISGFCALINTIVDLVEAIKEAKLSLKLGKAFLDFVVSLVSLVLLVYAIEHLKILLLILGTGIFILNVAFPEQEQEEVQTAQ